MQGKRSNSLVCLLFSLCLACTHELESGIPKMSGGSSLPSSDGRDSTVEAEVQSKLTDFNQCYQEEKKRDAKAFGKILLVFDILPDGHTDAVRLLASSLKSPVMEGCLVGKVESWIFSRPIDGKPITVRYPFSFSRS
ncbi:MAG: AgmX/PglI C-terminal domain-containing protein [Proteobacteria bacterium]|nr:AgmX/PglI C-terminal domain-containing protein [Pseudomonadota bacterium]